MLKKAFEKNPHVVQALLDENFQLKGVKRYSLGSPEEAKVYLTYDFFTWHKTEGAIEWLTEIICEIISKEIIAKHHKTKTPPKNKKV